MAEITMDSTLRETLLYSKEVNQAATLRGFVGPEGFEGAVLMITNPLVMQVVHRALMHISQKTSVEVVTPQQQPKAH